MAFWGVEVKPGKPYTHSYHPSHGRLRICQATLGSCDAAARTVVQCNVGNKTPIILCSLNPKLAEMCHLEIELEEDERVVFSVLGHSSIHLSGYYIRSSGRCLAGDDESESHGEDIGESDTDEEYGASDDSYESDFIDDGDPVVSEDKYRSDHTNDDDLSYDPDHHKKEDFERPIGKVERRRRIKKKKQVDSIDDKGDDAPYKRVVKGNGPSIFDSCSEDEDIPVSVYLANKKNDKVSEKVKSIVQAKDETRQKSNDVRKRKSDAISQNPESPMDMTGMDESSQAKTKKKSKKKMRSHLEVEDGKHSNKVRTLEDGVIIEDLSPGHLDAKTASNGCKVYVKYVGKLQDGKIVESNIDEKPFKFKLGAQKVIRGWDVGIYGMRVGEKRRLTIPPSMCNGDKEVGEVPKNLTVIYDVELVKVR